MSTILVLLGVLLLAAGAAFVLRRDKKQGKSSCSGNCGACGACGACHRCEANAKEKQAS